ATYHAERSPATDENIYYSTNATDFISPKSEMSLTFRNAVLHLAQDHTFARALVNSGRLSHPYRYIDSPLIIPDQQRWDSSLQPGWAVKDLTLFNQKQKTYLIDELGKDFSLIIFHQDGNELSRLVTSLTLPSSPNVKIIPICRQNPGQNMLEDREKMFRKRYAPQNGSWYLIRPDHHIAARCKFFSPEQIYIALKQAAGQESPSGEERDTSDLFTLYERDKHYKMLIQAHQGLSFEESSLLNARLVLLLMGQVKDSDMLAKFIDKAQN
ncbi:MAG: DUF2783 domain-containing protein, partial [Bacteroidetes bacterium]|nr:DUF2783 domain-containing protein [Bacteroidota bacterium]